MSTYDLCILFYSAQFLVVVSTKLQRNFYKQSIKKTCPIEDVIHMTILVSKNDIISGGEINRVKSFAFRVKVVQLVKGPDFGQTCIVPSGKFWNNWQCFFYTSERFIQLEKFFRHSEHSLIKFRTSQRFYKIRNIVVERIKIY